MRPSIVISVVLLAIVVMGLVLFVPGFFHAEKQMDSPAAAETAKVPAREPERSSVASVVKPVVLPSTNTLLGAVPAQTPSRIVEELQTLAMNDDADSLKSILAELTSSNAEIRAAARDAAVQFGDCSAAPALRAAAAQVESLEEKLALKEAADFLELPPLEVHSVTNPHPSRLSQPDVITNRSGLK